MDFASIFNSAWREWEKLPQHPNHEQCLDLTVPIRFRLFYSLQALWDEWARQAATGGWQTQDITGSAGQTLQPMTGRPYWEVWTVVRHDGNGKLIPPHMALGHEVCHVLDGMTKVMQNPDDLAQM